MERELQDTFPSTTTFSTTSLDAPLMNPQEQYEMQTLDESSTLDQFNSTNKTIEECDRQHDELSKKLEHLQQQVTKLEAESVVSFETVIVEKTDTQPIQSTTVVTTTTTPHSTAQEILIKVNDYAHNRKKYGTNYITTTKYKWYTFLILFLFEQYSKVYNIFFLVTMIFACIPGISPTNPITSILPVLFILGSALLRELFEDCRRLISDVRANGKPAKVYRYDPSQNPITPTPIKWSQITAGDLVVLEDEQECPADLLLLHSSLNEQGFAYIDTCNLDGETNLKLRKSVSITQQQQQQELFSQLQDAYVKCEKSDIRLYRFQGSLYVKSTNQNYQQTVLDHNHIILRGSVLRNTGTIIGMAVYTGRQTKLFKNLKKKSIKPSYLDTYLNLLLVFLLLVQQVLAISYVILYNVLNDYYVLPNYFNTFYIRNGATYTSFVGVLVSYMTAFILLNLFIPMSLFVSLEFLKAIQMLIIQSDPYMTVYEQVENHLGEMITVKKSMRANTSNLNADLSQIQIIFMDKTGTLTENKMQHHSLALRDKTFYNTNLQETQEQMQLSSQDANLIDYFTCLCTCHTITPQFKGDKVILDGESPDEIALLKFASTMNYKLLSNNNNIIRVNDQSYQVLEMIKFNSDRKRMSVFIRNQEEEGGDVICYCKGADSIMMKRIDPMEELVGQNIQEKVNEFSNQGLRTLLFCSKRIPLEEFESWHQRYREALLINDETMIDEVGSQIEHQFRIIAVAGIEDKLQEKVPETIKFFLDANCQMWMLTGDKRETAMNIAQSANLFDREDTIALHVGAHSVEQVTEQLQQIQNRGKLESNSKQHYGLVIDGESLSFVFGTPLHPMLSSAPWIVRYFTQKKYHAPAFDLFLKIIPWMKTVIVCRATPLQKALMVRLMRRKFSRIGLAIGDGANDVSMIQEARVGVGIMGLEGSQASRAADYAIPKFYILKRLLAVHGRYSLSQIGLFIQYSFYKNMVVTVTQVFFSCFNLFSGQTFFDSWFLTLYNLLLTVLVPFVLGLFERDVKQQVLMQNPLIYRDTQEKENILNFKSFSQWALQAIYHAAVIFFWCALMYYYAGGIVEQHGSADGGFWHMSTTCSILIIWVVNLKAILVMRYFTIIHILCIAFSIIAGYVFYILYNLVTYDAWDATSYPYWMFFELFVSARFHLLLLVTIVTALLPDVALQYGKSFFFAHRWETLTRRYWSKKLKQKCDTCLVARRGTIGNDTNPSDLNEPLQ